MELITAQKERGHRGHFMQILTASTARTTTASTTTVPLGGLWRIGEEFWTHRMADTLEELGWMVAAESAEPQRERERLRKRHTRVQSTQVPLAEGADHFQLLTHYHLCSQFSAPCILNPLHPAPYMIRTTYRHPVELLKLRKTCGNVHLVATLCHKSARRPTVSRLIAGALPLGQSYHEFSALPWLSASVLSPK